VELDKRPTQPQPPPMDLRGNVDCRFFLQGTCGKGAGCPFRHDTGKAAAPSERYSSPCIYFQQGYCARGDSCLYRHDACAKDGAEAGSATAEPKHPAEVERLLRQQIRERMSRPLAAGPGPQSTPLTINKSPQKGHSDTEVEEGELMVEFSPTNTTPVKPPPPPKREPARSSPDVSGLPKQRVFGAAARKRAEALGALPKKAEGEAAEAKQQQEAANRKRAKAPIVWGAAQQELKKDESVEKKLKTTEETATQGSESVSAPKAKPAPIPSPSPAPKPAESSKHSGTKAKAPITFKPQPIAPMVRKAATPDNGATATPAVPAPAQTKPTVPAPSAPKAQPAAPSNAPASVPTPIKVPVAGNPDSTAAKVATPKSKTPKGSLDRCMSTKSAGDNDEGLEELEDLENSFEETAAEENGTEGGDADFEEPEDDDLDELAEDELADLEAEFS